MPSLQIGVICKFKMQLTISVVILQQICEIHIESIEHSEIGD